MTPKPTSEVTMSEDQIDETLMETFPASDPPQWTLGIARSPDENGGCRLSDSRAQAAFGPASRIARKRRQAT
jgi:hypothetical protein